MEKTYKMCQSCGMPMRSDPQGGGFELDGSKSKMYCSFCYDNGEFRNKDIDLQGMREMSIRIINEKMNIPIFLGKFITRNMKNLERWKK